MARQEPNILHRRIAIVNHVLQRTGAPQLSEILQQNQLGGRRHTVHLACSAWYW